MGRAQSGVHRASWREGTDSRGKLRGLRLPLPSSPCARAKIALVAGALTAITNVAARTQTGSQVESQATTQPGASSPASDRIGAFGMVRNRDGAPWAGAHVILRSRPIADLEVPPVDTIEVVTDDQGRFRVAVLPARSYSAWAHGDPERDGSYRA